MGEPGDFYDPLGLMADPFDDLGDLDSKTGALLNATMERKPGDPDHNAGWTEEGRRLQREAAERADRGFEAWGEFWISLLPGVGEAQEIREVSADPNLSAGEKVAGYAWAAAGFIPAVKVINIADKIADAADKVDDVRDATKSVEKATDATKVGDKAADAKGAAQVDKSSTKRSGCASPASQSQVKSELQKLPQGKQKRVRTVDSENELSELYEKLTAGGTTVDPGAYPGVVKKLPDGTEVRMRPTSRSGGSTIDITYPDGSSTKVHVR
jgi:hypothetical protein